MKDKLSWRDDGHGGCEGWGCEPLVFRENGSLSCYEEEYVVAAEGHPRNCLGQQKNHVLKQDLGSSQWEGGTGRVC